MATVKITVSLDAEVASALRLRASELGKPASRYLADLIREDIRRDRDELAAEGYEVLAAGAAEFAAAALLLAAETWPEWEGIRTEDSGKRESPHTSDGVRQVISG